MLFIAVIQFATLFIPNFNVVSSLFASNQIRTLFG